MTELKKLGMNGKELGKFTLPPALFGVEVNEHVIYEYVRNYLANQRQGTSSVKTRATMSGGGKKPWRQKGSGKARAGTNTSPVWVGGGRAFGPHPRDYSYSIPAKVKRLALKCALSAKAKEDSIYLLDNLTLESPKTKEMARIINDLGLGGKKCTLILASMDKNISLSVRNIPHVRPRLAANLNAYDLIDSEAVVFTHDALTKLIETLGEA